MAGSAVVLARPVRALVTVAAVAVFLAGAATGLLLRDSPEPATTQPGLRAGPGALGGMLAEQMGRGMDHGDGEEPTQGCAGC